MGKHLKQKSAPVKTEKKKSAARRQPVKSAPPRKTFLDMIAPGVMKFNPDVYTDTPPQIAAMYMHTSRTCSSMR